MILFGFVRNCSEFPKSMKDPRADWPSRSKSSTSGRFCFWSNLSNSLGLEKVTFGSSHRKISSPKTLSWDMRRRATRALASKRTYFAPQTPRVGPRPRDGVALGFATSNSRVLLARPPWMLTRPTVVKWEPPEKVESREHSRGKNLPSTSEFDDLSTLPGL